MYGEIVSVDAAGHGEVLGPDSLRHPFRASACLGRLEPGQKVEFAVADGAAIDIFKLSPARYQYGLEPTRAELEEEEPAPFRWLHVLGSPHGRLARIRFLGSSFVFNLLGGLIGLIPVVGVIALWPHIAMRTKRLHDMGLSGWLQILPVVLIVLANLFATFLMIAPMFGLVGLLLTRLSPLTVPVYALAILIDFLFFAWLAGTPGQAGPNRYGADPHDPNAAPIRSFAY